MNFRGAHFYLASARSHDTFDRLLNFRTGILEHVQAAFYAIGNVNQAIGIDIEIVEHRRLLTFRRRWNEEADFFRPELIADIEHAQTGIVVSHENNILALE